MGGKNHQPCRAYLANSTKLSRAFSVANAELELGNVALEDLLLEELAGSRGSIQSILVHLGKSLVGLQDAISASNRLRQQMDEAGYVDLPTLNTIDWSVVKRRLIEGKLVGENEWNEVVTTMKGGGFYTMLNRIDTLIVDLIDKTNVLFAQVSALKCAAETGSVNQILEENREGNLRPAFAQLYCAWSRANQLFLASSLVSTEIWYSFNNYGSLVSGAQVRAA